MPNSASHSQLATASGAFQPARPRRLPLWGAVVHTTGRALPERALQNRQLPVDLAVRLYSLPGAPSPHYVVGWSGEIVQVQDDALLAAHAGIDEDERSSYLSGAWRTKLSSAGLTRWHSRWPEAHSPLDLFPAGPVNDQFLGIELIPRLTRSVRNGTLFTDDQYAALDRLLDDIADRHQLDLSGPRLLGHEDINPLRRWDSSGGWDPGSLRSQPFFRWELLHRPKSAADTPR